MPGVGCHEFCGWMLYSYRSWIRSLRLRITCESQEGAFPNLLRCSVSRSSPRHPASVFRLPTSHFLLPASYFLLPTSYFPLQNLPLNTTITRSFYIFKIKTKSYEQPDMDYDLGI